MCVCGGGGGGGGGGWGCIFVNISFVDLEQKLNRLRLIFNFCFKN